MRRLDPWGFIGIGVLACDLFLYGASVVFAPWWIVVVMVLLWLVMLAVCARNFGPRPMVAFWVSILGVVLWFGEIGLAVALT